ncbi:hypothetical protein SLS62_002226 [Diatrype stigma]|uniref:Uncharacterized protein n=1 Tax=Diatrype stigma TaxID=117547 RepID=A0AAN9UYU9_9PEZI
MSFLNLLLVAHRYVLPPLAIVLPVILYYVKLTQKRSPFATPNKARAATAKGVKALRSNPSTSKPVQWYRTLYFQLQNLEDHPAVLGPARDELLAMFSRAISLGLEQPRGSILSMERYHAKKVWEFIGNEHDRVMTEWNSYLERRKKGHSPELFATTAAAAKWLVRQAPVKFVDGAWLGHIHKITTPFSLRAVTKDVWQVMSEELGDGDLSKHHVYLYRQLLKDVGCSLPDGHTAEFIKPCYWDGTDDRGAWQAAVGQLLISLFPSEFLPEILGFNMHYELITMDTMRASYELKALGINPYYFLIHIAIDNADSGHTAMATHAVTRYLDTLRATEGEAAAQKAWKRVQVGYTLSQTLGDPHFSESECSSSTVGPLRFSFPNATLDPLSTRMIEIFKNKASFSHQFHCQSRVRIGGHTLAEWLSPGMWTHPHSQQHLELLSGLVQAKPWIVPGASHKSLLVRELSWEGRMFGAFTHDEVATLTAWIDSMGTGNHPWLYWSYTGREPSISKDVVSSLRDPVRHHPVVMSPDLDNASSSGLGQVPDDAGPSSGLRMERQLLAPSSSARLPDIVALWFAHIGLLENTINTPSRTASPFYAKVLRVLRAQAGFAAETHIVAGMDEMRRISCPSLVDIGLELISRCGFGTRAQLCCLQDVFDLTRSQGQDEETAALSHDMLHWGTRPNANLGLLLGLALVFLELKDAVAKAPELLSEESQAVLRAIVARERQSLEDCERELRSADEKQYRRLLQGYRIGSRALDKCLCAGIGTNS